METPATTLPIRSLTELASRMKQGRKGTWTLATRIAYLNSDLVGNDRIGSQVLNALVKAKLRNLDDLLSHLFFHQRPLVGFVQGFDDEWQNDFFNWLAQFDLTSLLPPGYEP
jgi:hypothetical protein